LTGFFVVDCFPKRMIFTSVQGLTNCIAFTVE
jgi:hypothetical protein